MKKVQLFFIVFLLAGIAANAQTLDELKAEKAEKEAVKATIDEEISGLDKQIKEFPGWTIGGLGLLGLDLAGNSDWFAADQPQSSQNSLGLGFTAYANSNMPKTFWRNGLSIATRRSVSKANSDAEEVESISDILNLNSLGGYKVMPTIALSGEANYASTIFNLNNPGKLQASLGATWLPIPDLVVLIHPLGYEINFPSGDTISSPGAKIRASYVAEIMPGISWNSDFNAFAPYSGGTTDLGNTYTAGELFNWTWMNGFGIALIDGIGIGLNTGLRGDRQLRDLFNDGLEQSARVTDNPIQFFYNLGLTYGF